MSVEENNKSQLAFRGKRLEQVFWFVEAILGLIALQQFFYEASGWVPALLLVLMLCLLSVYFLIKQGQIDKAAVVLTGSITVLCVVFMWTFQGLRDEVLMAFPGVLIFSGLLGNRKLFFTLTFFIIANVLLLGYFNSQGWYVNVISTADFSVAVVLSLILLLVAFSIWLLSSDLHNVLQKLSKENFRVKESEKKIQRLVHHDALTNLPNRLLAKDRFEHAYKASKRESSMVCLMFLDLDNFKVINDSFGHSAGDIFLQEIASRLQCSVRDTDTICRQGGMNFWLFWNLLLQSSRFHQLPLIFWIKLNSLLLLEIHQLLRLSQLVLSSRRMMAVILKPCAKRPI
nr:diguanylate cyclase [Oceanicoccus sp. KOV_DT_Chl]